MTAAIGLATRRPPCPHRAERGWHPARRFPAKYSDAGKERHGSGGSRAVRQQDHEDGEQAADQRRLRSLAKSIHTEDGEETRVDDDLRGWKKVFRATAVFVSSPRPFGHAFLIKVVCRFRSPRIIPVDAAGKTRVRIQIAPRRRQRCWRSPRFSSSRPATAQSSFVTRAKIFAQSWIAGQCVAIPSRRRCAITSAIPVIYRGARHSVGKLERRRPAEDIFGAVRTQ